MTMTTAQAAVTGGFKVDYLLASLATAPASDTYTDGYQITIDATIGADFVATTATSICVQTLDSEGVAVAAAVATEGAHWLCMGFVGTAAKLTTNAATLKTQTHAAYACYDQTTACSAAGTVVSGTDAISAANLTDSAFVAPATNVADALKQDAKATFKWSQPKPASTYALTMRRYGAGDKVMLYQLLGGDGTSNAGTAVTAAHFNAHKTAAITLAGAAALATGVALGAAALAF